MEDRIIMLTDEQGNDYEFEVIDVFEFNDETYFALVEVMPEGEESDEVLMMKVRFGETDDDTDLIHIEDDDELEACFAEFTKRYEESEE